MIERLSQSVLVFIAAIALVVPPASASKGDSTVRLGIALVTPTSDSDPLDLDPLFGLKTTKATSAVGLELGYEFMVSDLIGFSVDVSRTNHDVEEDGKKIAEVSLTPMMVGANFHVLRRDPLDLYVGVQTGRVLIGDSKEVGGGTSKNEHDTAVGVVVGGSVSVGGGGVWTVVGAARIYSTQIVSTRRDFLGTNKFETAVHPAVVTIGVGYGF